MVMKVLSVAEKPSVARELAKILSNGTASSRRGEAQYNMLYDFSCTLDGRPCQMVVTSVIGHLFEQDFEESHRKWGSCSPLDLFDARITSYVPDDKKDIARNLEHAVRGCEQLLLWLDCDREGEAIGFEVIDVCTHVNRRLRVRRARFSALIPRDIHAAMANLREPDKRQADAVRARSELDLRLGAAFTRLQTTTLQHQFEGLDGLVSYGACQFPTLWFVVQVKSVSPAHHAAHDPRHPSVSPSYPT